MLDDPLAERSSQTSGDGVFGVRLEPELERRVTERLNESGLYWDLPDGLH